MPPPRSPSDDGQLVLLQCPDAVAVGRVDGPSGVEALRVAKPGAMLLAFSGTRTFHRLTCAIEDAGWEIRDCLSWMYGSGFPKSLDISKAIDRQRYDLGEVYEVTAWIRSARDAAGGFAHPIVSVAVHDSLERLSKQAHRGRTAFTGDST